MAATVASYLSTYWEEASKPSTDSHYYLSFILFQHLLDYRNRGGLARVWLLWVQLWWCEMTRLSNSQHWCPLTSALYTLPYDLNHVDNIQSQRVTKEMQKWQSGKRNANFLLTIMYSSKQILIIHTGTDSWQHFSVWLWQNKGQHFLLHLE